MPESPGSHGPPRPSSPEDGAAIATGAAPAGLSPSDLADLMARFEEAAHALQGTHQTLGEEVRRLERELGETRGQLRRAQDLAALGEMAAGIAHEIRNPLGSIRLYAEALVEDLHDRASERTLATKIARAVDSMNAVVGDVLVFSREARVCPQMSDVGDIVAHAIDACASMVRANGVRLSTTIEHDDALSCDPTLIHQALVNVIRNACEAASEGSEAPAVRVVVGRRAVLTESGRRAPVRSIRVEDNGPGIPPEVHERMFNPFFTTRATGTGLGLAIVHRILDAHGGRVDIRAPEGGAGGATGACVELLIPDESRDVAAARVPPDDSEVRVDARPREYSLTGGTP